MPQWFLIALISPIAWALVNHLDKYATVKYANGIGIGGIMVVTCLFSVILVPIAFAFDGGVFDVLPAHKGILIVNGIMNSLAGVCYLYAIKEDEASTVAPLFQLVPVLGFILGYFILGETLSNNQIFGSLVIVLSAVFLLIEFESGSRVRFKLKVAALMFLSSLFYALFQVLFKAVAVKEDFWRATFWEYIGITLSGIGFLVFVKPYRVNFSNIFRSKQYCFLNLMALLEALNIVGNMATAFASLLAPIALVMLMNSYQPVFVFLFGIIITVYLPFIGKEKLTIARLVRKIACIVAMTLGTYVLYG